MSRTLELPEPVYEALEKAAQAAGVSPAGWLERLLGFENGTPHPKEEKNGTEQLTMYDVLKDVIGKFHFGEAHFSQNTGEKFADILEQKRKEGHL